MMGNRRLSDCIIGIYFFFAGLVCQAQGAEPGNRHVIILAPDEEPKKQSIQVATVGDLDGVSPNPRNRDEIYSAIWRHPDQTFIDSDLGPVPLYTEVVFDQYGNPRPRFPDLNVKLLLDDPTPERALVYLENQKVRMRRYLQASQIMREVAAQTGYVTDDAFRGVDQGSMASREIVPDTSVAPQYQGIPAMTPQQARLNGLKVDEIPMTPGRVTSRYVEVVYLWDHRCTHSMAGYRDFAQVGSEVFQRELGPRFLAVSLDNDSPKVRAKLDFLDYTGVQTMKVDNFIDQTDLRKTLNVTKTPTYVFIDRRTGKLLRLEGKRSADDIRQTLLNLVGRGEEKWGDADPRWFRPVKQAIGSGQGIEIKEVGSDLKDATPILPSSRQIRAWDPNGQAD